MRRRFTHLLGGLALFASLQLSATTGIQVEAENYDNSSGAQAESGTAGSGGGNVGYIQNGTWIMFTGYSFDGNEEGIDLAAASNGSGGNIEVRVGSESGTLIGTATINPTGGWHNYLTVTIAITQQSAGAQDLYFVFTGGSGYLFNFDYFTFTGATTSYSLATSVSPANAGEIAQSPAGTDIVENTPVTLTATDGLGYNFAHWADGGGTQVSTDNPYTFDMTANTELQAIFSQVNVYTITDVSPAGVDVYADPNENDGSYNAGVSVELTAGVMYGYQFVQWEDGSDGFLSSANPYTVTMNSSVTVEAITEPVTSYALPEWTFNDEYVQESGESVTYHTPIPLVISSNISGADAWLYPNNATYGNVGASGDADQFSTNDVSGRKVARITWTDANSVSDFTDPSQHAQFYQFEFSTIGFTGIGLDFNFSGGQSNDQDYLELVYSVDGGTTWVDGGATNAGAHWNTWINGTPSLTGADDNEHVIVRLIGITATTGGSRNFNLDDFKVTGSAKAAITWTGASSTDWGTAGNWDNGVPTATDNVIIPTTSNDPVVDGDFAVHEINIADGEIVTVESGSSLAILGAASGAGEIAVSRNINSNNGYSIVGVPVWGATVEDLSANLAYYYDEAEAVDKWFEPTGSLDPGIGVFVAKTDGTLSISGSPVWGNLSVDVSADNDGFNLVANPYAAAISTDDWLTANDNALASGSVYFWDDGGSNESDDRGGDYVAYNGLGSVGTIDLPGTGMKGSARAANGYIGTMQGFFVEADGAVSVTFTADMQVTDTDANIDGNFYRKADDNKQLLKLSIAGNGLSNELLIGYVSDATMGKDFAYDATKFSGNDQISFYSMMGEEKLAIQGLPQFESDPIDVNLGMDLHQAGEYTIAVEQFKGFPSNLSVMLIDELTGEAYELGAQVSVPFTTDEVVNAQRFKVVVAPAKVLSVDDLTDKLQVFGGDSELKINFASSKTELVRIYSLDGRSVFSSEVKFDNNLAVINPSINRNQVYVLRINNEAIKFVLK